MTDTHVARQTGDEMDARRDEGVVTPEQERLYAPAVDISEDSDHIRLVADMPGVDQSTVSVTVESGVLSIEGQACVEAPEGYACVGREFCAGRYRREFTLSDAVDTERISARVRHGVLEVQLPKREQVKARKVKIEV